MEGQAGCFLGVPACGRVGVTGEIHVRTANKEFLVSLAGVS